MTTPPPNSDALMLAELGVAVLEVAAVREDGECRCRMGAMCPSPGKHPIGRHWNRRASTKPRHVAARTRLTPITSYGLMPLPDSGVIIVDRDDPSAAELPIPETFAVTRPSATEGRGHFYLRLPDGIAEEDVPRTFHGGEVAVAGSRFVVGPGCRHVSGDLYESNGADVGYATTELVEALRASPAVRRTKDGAVEAVLGSRHEWLVGQARKYRGWDWDEERIAEKLEADNEEFCVPPLSAKAAEFGRMAAWAMREVQPDAVMKVTKKRKRAARGWAS